MMPTKVKTRQLLFAFALVGGLGTAEMISRSANEHDVVAQAVRGAAVAQAADEPQIIKITASRFQFSPNRISLKKGQPVTLKLTSTDRIHGFLIRALKIDTDIKSGKSTEITVTPKVAGTFKAICDHYCGLGHGNMKMTVVVQ